MHRPPAANVPILITKTSKTIRISGRLYKSGSLSHDPNIGVLSIISAVLRKLGWKDNIVITHHGLEQKHVGKTNKFVQIANKLNIGLQGLIVPPATFRQNGIKELAGYDAFDKLYLKKYYPNFKIVRTVVLYGSNNQYVGEIEVGFLLNEKGKLVLGVRAPKLFTKAIKNLLSYWR